MMRSMSIAKKLDLESLHHKIGGKLYRGRPEKLLPQMSKDRNVQLFRRGTIQVLGHLTQHEVEETQRELLQHLEITSSNLLVISQCSIEEESMSPKDSTE